MGSFFGLATAISGLRAQQAALNTVNHNIANASTTGYSRQRVTMEGVPQAVQPSFYAASPIMPGAGVEIEQLVRLRDSFVDNQVRQQLSTLGQWTARSDGLARVEGLINEPSESGLAATLQAFFSSFQALARNPESTAAREAVRTAGQTLATTIQTINTQLTGVQTDTDAMIADRVAQVNTLAGQINSINQEIAKSVGAGMEPNDLYDQRDVMIDNLNRIAGVSVTTPAGALGKVSVSLGAALLVDATTNTVSALAVSGAGVVTVGAAVTTLADGQLRGLIDLRDTVLGGAGGYLQALDDLTAGLIGAVNTQHASGFDLAGGTGAAFFAGTGASTIALSAAVLASTSAIAASDSAANVPGGSANALALAQLERTAITIGAGTAQAGDYYASLIGRIGTDADQANRFRLVHEGIATASQNRRDAVAGVNIDEEVADMVKFQRSYAAAARMVTTMDQLLETVVERLGIVGR